MVPNVYKYGPYPTVNRWISFCPSAARLDVRAGSSPNALGSKLLISYYLEDSISMLSKCPPQTIRFADSDGRVDKTSTFYFKKDCSAPCSMPKGHIVVHLPEGPPKPSGVVWKYNMTLTSVF